MSALPRILLLDDDPSVHRGVELRLRGFAELTGCFTGAEASARIGETRFDAALIDVNLGEGASGIELVGTLRLADPDLAAVVFTAHSDYDTAMDALRAHCFGFIPKSLRKDEEFRVKLNEAIAHTRAHRMQTAQAGDAGILRTALAEIRVESELEVTSADIQRGLLAESLQSFSGLLGRVELMEMHLRQRAEVLPRLGDLVRLSEETVGELQDYIGHLRDYFAAPERATRSIGEIVGRAIAVVRAGLGEDARIELREMRPDAPFQGDGRALLRAIVVLLRLMLSRSEGAATVSVRPYVMFNPYLEMHALKSRGGARILRTCGLGKQERTALGIEILGPREGSDADAIASLFSLGGTAGDIPRASAWNALAMLARVDAALILEARRDLGVRYTIILKNE